MAIKYALGKTFEFIGVTNLINIGIIKLILERIFQYAFSLMQHVLGMWEDCLKFCAQTLFIKSRF